MLGTVSGMDSEQIRQTLEQEGSRLGNMRSDLRSGSDLDAEDGDSGGELSTVDQHPADIATEHQQREVDLSMLEQVEAELSDVENALRKLDDGSYGTCEVCGNPIGEERLQALPATRYCMEHAGVGSRVVDLDASTDVGSAHDSASPI